jgi:hypothetical protein
MDWHHIKDWLEHAIGLNMDALHVHAGFLLQLASAIVMRRPLSSPWPWLAVVAAESANEIYDYTYEVWPGAERQIQLAEGIRDFWNTLVIPSLMLILARYAPALFTAQPKAEASAADPG